jgi:hypothetical protein
MRQALRFAVLVLVALAAAASMPQQGRRQTRQPTAYQAVECVNDYGCPYGSTCVHDGTSSYCAKKVNEYGVQTFSGPDPSSGRIKTSGCMFDTQCPPSYRCAKALGAVYGTCVK